jgi:hypothetical protein
MSEDFVLVNDEPMHRQRWISDSVRLVCAQIPAHAKSLWHQHLKYGVYIVVAPLDCTEQSVGNEPKALTSHVGEVFCRDHTQDHLIHVVQTSNVPAFLVEVELLREKDALLPNANLPLHTGPGIELLQNVPECRVYRLSLKPQGNVQLELPTETVLVAVRACSVVVTTSAGPSQRELAPGDDIVLSAGSIALELVAEDGDASQDPSAQLVLTEVY